MKKKLRGWLAASTFLTGGFCLWMIQRPRDTVFVSRPSSDLVTLVRALKLYRQTTGVLPTNEQGLNALIERPADLPSSAQWFRMSDVLPKDPWGNSYHYFRSDALPNGFGIYSMGQDGVSRSGGNDEGDANSRSEK